VAHFERRKGRGTMNEADYFDGDTEEPEEQFNEEEELD
jgi:hypothetical protein